MLTRTACGALPVRVRVERPVRPHASHSWRVAAALMPERDDFQRVASHAVIQEIVDSPEIKPSDDLRSRRLHFAPDAGLANEQIERTAKIRHDCAWSGWSVLSPPLSRRADLAFCSALDADLECQVPQKR